MSAEIDDAPDWPLQATEAIVGFVDNVKGKTTRRATIAIRSVVYGVIIVAIAIPIIILLLVGLVNILSFAIDDNFGVGIWVVYLGLGLIFTIAGFILWRKRTT